MQIAIRALGQVSSLFVGLEHLKYVVTCESRPTRIGVSAPIGPGTRARRLAGLRSRTG